jgi:hypothetical protein
MQCVGLTRDKKTVSALRNHTLRAGGPRSSRLQEGGRHILGGGGTGDS